VVSSRSSKGQLWEVRIRKGGPPAGSVEKGDMTYMFNQGPSEVDIERATAPLNIVVGARDKQVYFYNNTGNLGQMSYGDFMKEQK
jgi:hypothetical protein